jgi:hypothetical protein
VSILPNGSVTRMIPIIDSTLGQYDLLLSEDQDSR